ncbi:hypothetical protein NX862_02970 [Rhodobacter sp. KR11]|uniref:helix-turn-helix domain-containing protein n=1 Tax=Rhodobacter sp. KR11 TaxID=2974588 RepID=UPI002221CBD9|nr:helix-turn-helix domain-containing protein [Rhodobacter sp. KR11]MCW1917705.1 hypothetical protein [Rhodobacter sp. KR11]
MQEAAILTGDLIGSTEAPPGATEAALGLIAQTLIAQALIAPPSDTTETATPHPMATRAEPTPAPRFTLFRGDGWQCALAPDQAPRMALRLLACLTAAGGLQSRIAIGLGAVEDWGKGGDLSQARGSALTASGRALDAMTGLLALAAPDLPATIAHRDQALIRLWEVIARRWSPAQAEAMDLALQGLRQTEIAARLGVSPQAVSLRLKAAEAGAVIDSLTLWEAAMRKDKA